MRFKTSIAWPGLAFLAATAGQPAMAQGALGRAMSHAFARGAQTISDAGHGAAQHPAATTVTPAHAASKRAPARGKVVPATLGTGDALAGTDATTCHQSNGTTIRVSGGYRPPAADSGECR